MTLKIKHMPIHSRPAFELSEPKAARVPYVFASPHSGRHYPERLVQLSRLERRTLRRSEDAYVDRLMSRMPELGAPLLCAIYPRVYVDLNRDPLELDPSMFKDKIPMGFVCESERVIAGFGLIPRVVALDLDIYRRKLDYNAEKSRIKDIYRPYHAKLYDLIMAAKARHGWAALIDCHSMPSVKINSVLRFSKRIRQIKNAPLADPDIVLGDRFARSCSGRLVSALESMFCDLGYTVARNEPYAGGFCTENYGKPAENLHAIQIEINRRLYMNERTIQPRGQAFEKLKTDLDQVMGELMTIDLGYARPQAAE
jgi:N-formylglutamate amidohydrolase